MVCPAAATTAQTTVVDPVMKENAASKNARESASASVKEQPHFPILRIRWTAASTDAARDVKNAARKDVRRDAKTGGTTDGMTDVGEMIPVAASHKIF